MKLSSKMLNRLKIIFLALTVTCFFNSCATSSKITLTPEQQNVQILKGDQATTLALMNTHTPLATERVRSEYEARARAVFLNADVAQLILYSNYSSLTYRFWKHK
jgi:hypothetical protein